MKLAKKLVVVAIVASIPFAAHARNNDPTKGAKLAQCAGTIASASELALKAGDARASKVLAAAGLRFIKDSKRFIDSDSADELAVQRMRQWDDLASLPGAGKWLERDMEACLKYHASL